MITLSLPLPDPLAKASQDVARQLGVSRVQFIRLAITHELEHYESLSEQKAMAQSMLSMKESKDYLLEAKEITEGLNTVLPKEKKQWWIKKS